MDSEQIQQQMRVRRAAIDAKLDVIAQRTATVRRRAVPALIATVSTLVAIVVWSRRRSHKKALSRSSRLRLAG